MNAEQVQEFKKHLCRLVASDYDDEKLTNVSIDLRSVTRHNIPYTKYGYKTLEQCFDDMPDVIQRKGSYIRLVDNKPNSYISQIQQVYPEVLPATLPVRPERKSRVRPRYLRGEFKIPRANKQYNRNEEVKNIRLDPNIPVPLEVQQNLINLIRKFNDGIWLRDLSGAYERIYKKELDFTKYGYRKLVVMCFKLERIFFCFLPRNSEDHILYDVWSQYPLNFQKYYGDPMNIKIKATDVEAALRMLPKPSYPLNVLLPSDTVPSQFPLYIKKEDRVKICIGEIYSPEFFFVILQNYSDELDDLMNEMQ